MKMKLTSLMFGLLLAVGWTNVAQAQALPKGGFAERMGIEVGKLSQLKTKDKVAELKVGRPAAPNDGKSMLMNAPRRADEQKPNAAVHNRAYYDALTYTWTDAEGPHESKATDVATKPEQMYELLKFVYTDKRFPGPYYTAYTANNVQERPVYYGGIAGGWEIGNEYSAMGNITIQISQYSGSYPVYIKSIKVMSGSTEVTSWEYVEGSTSLTEGWTATGTSLSVNQNGELYFGGSSGTITIPANLLEGYSNVNVIINARSYDEYYSDYMITVNGTQKTLTSTSLLDYTWSVTASATLAPDGTYKPTEDGYTALVVAVKNTTTLPAGTYNSYDTNNSITLFNSKDEIIGYFRDNVDFIQLLTDGLRIGSEDDYSIGTVFSCDGTYNKFFFLSKGQSRQKDSQVISLQSTYGLMGEDVPFKEMFEQFSPTQGDAGSEITDFYSKMNEGNVYNVVHDCASVIQNGHQFSMSGNNGTTSYAMTGLNFFIPDYRLKYWTTSGPDNYSSYTVDGRTMNPYLSTSGYKFRNVPSFCSNYAQYNQLYAPKVGIYKITLDATANQVAQIYAPGNRNYAVTLTWVSSLNEMSGHEVPQTYTVYYFDENGNRQALVVEGVTNTNGQTGVTTLTYYVEQFEHSYTIDYIVEGSPADTEHPQFVAISNVDGVVIPGWNDFVGLELDHHESDFVVADMANWYRNFLSVVNEDLYNGLTVSAVTGANGNTPMNKFSLYRYNYNGTQASSAETKIADIELFNATPAQVSYRVTYDDDGTNSTLEDQQVLAAKYQRQAMGIADEGVIRVKGNGDLVIWPNNYFVNFRSITVKNGTQTVTSWNAASMNTLPSGWETSPGSKWEEFTHNGVKVGYMEGGGYIYIPNLLNQYNNLSVEIEAFGEGANVKRIAVNDVTKDITATAAGTTYTWTSLSPNALHAPKMATESHEYSYTFTNNPFSATTTSTSLGGITWNCNNTSSFYGWENNRSAAQFGSKNAVPSTVTLSTSGITGTIKSVVVTAGAYSSSATIGVSVNGAQFGGSAQNLATGNTLGTYTFTGSSSGNIQITMTNPNNGGRALYIGSITVTYETESGEETTTADLTVCDGNYFSEQLPVYGYYYDCAQHNQLVYPASMLTAMAGKKIKSMTFYPTSGYVDEDQDGQYDSGETTYSGLNFSGGSVTFKLANLSSGTAAFADQNATLITGTMTPVKTLTPTANSTATTWVIEFDQEFEYTGGDLLIDITSAVGTDNHTAFSGNVVDANQGAFTFTYNNTSYALGSVFLPKVTFAYETEGGEAPAVEGGLLRMHMLLVDQLKQEIPVDNSHPDAYGYVLRFEPNGPEGDGKKQSGHVKVNIEKTDAQPNGYYTVAQINNDKNIDTTLLTMDILDAQVKMNLNDENPNVLYFQMQGAAKNSIPDTYLSQLQYMKNVRKYEEMLEGSSHKGEQYDADKVHYYFNDATPERGSYSDDDYKAYAPSVSTWGIDRRYFEVDGENNTYGAPVWKTAVGKAQMGLVPDQPNDPTYMPTVLFQEGWNTSWTVDGQGSNLYMLDNINAIGYLPKKEVTNVDYEPYMFRVFVQSDNSKLRPFKYVTVTDDEGKSHSVITADENGSKTGPTCVWSGYMLDANGEIITSDPNNGVVIDFESADGPFYYTKNKVQRTPTPEPTEDNPNPERPAWDKDENNAIFGALDDLLEITGYKDGKPIYKDIPEEDLRIFVRFYYMVKGWNANSMSLRAGEGEGDEARPGNGAQSPGSAAGRVATAVHEIQYLGEIVSQTYYNVQGMVSDKPFDGVNIVVTRFGNGTTSVSKIVR